MNNIYIYDGHYSSFLALLSQIIYLKKIPYSIRSENEYVPSLFDETIYLKIDNKKEKIEHFINLFDKKIMKYVYYVFLSNTDNKEIVIYYFLKNALVYKKNIFSYRKLNCVNDVIKISHYVSNEVHKLKGFLRFKKMSNNFYYATISPTNNIIGLLSEHFKNRLSGEYWIIKDTKRNIYSLYDTKSIKYLNEIDIVKLNLDISSEELLMEDLWKTFFNTISIKERTNLKCQMNFMPKKYWNNIIEMEDKL